jgi:hypothetical protein
MDPEAVSTYNFLQPLFERAVPTFARSPFSSQSISFLPANHRLAFLTGL